MNICKPIVLGILMYLNCLAHGEYIVGIGIADVTGPAGEINMMGYAKSEQKTSGIHMRLYSRAYIIKDKAKSIVFVSVDIGMISQIIKTRVSEIVSEKYKGLYNTKNVALSATHTHSGPGGYHQYLLFSLTSLGFIKQSFDAIVEGIVRSIDNAHENLQPMVISLIKSNLEGSSINRSPTSYLLNPLSEREKYSSNVDTTVTMLRFDSTKGKEMGIIVWFAVHATNINNQNLLISGDNKGYASQMFERYMNGRNSLPGKGPFIASFAQSNEGDVSPNTRGARCLDTGEPCDQLKSSCNGRATLCVAQGPGKDMYDSMRIIGDNEFQNALATYKSSKTRWLQLTGPIDFVHQFIDMSGATVTINNTVHKTCSAAMGFSFAAGTTDGPGEFDFTQGDKEGSKFWNMVRNVISKPSQEDMDCQAPKPILLNTGRLNFPYPWTPSIVETQILRVGELVIIPVPGEFTTMAGRRVRETVLKAYKDNKETDVMHGVIAGLSNVYADYVVTYEEYQAQRYEAASTLYGPHTLMAYQQQYERLAAAMCQKIQLGNGPTPPYFVNKLITFQTGVVYDATGIGKHFGQVLKQPKSSYLQGEEVSVRFVSAHPRNNLRLENTYMRVEQYDNESKQWYLRYTDANFETTFLWKRTNASLAWSEAILVWRIPLDQAAGTYRIIHEGTSKEFLTGNLKGFSGTSDAFRVNPM